MSKDKNINSFAENMRKTITAQVNALNLIESIQKSIADTDTIVEYDYTKLKDGETVQHQLPSFTAIDNKVQAIERNLQNLTNGRGSLTMTDGSRRQIKLTSLPKTPDRITGLKDPSMFSVDSNWFFEDLMFPGVTVKVDLTGKIEDSADRVKVARIVLDNREVDVQNFWESNIVGSNIDYVSLKALLAYNGIRYSEDIEVIQLPLVSNSLSGSFQIVQDPEIINGQTWYTLDKVKYSTIDTDGIVKSENNVLSIGDQLAYNDTLYTVKEIDQNTNKVRLKLLNGSAFPGVYSIFRYYQDPFRSKVIDVRFGAHEYDIIYIKGVNEDFNLLSNEWSTPIKFDSDSLVFSEDVNNTFEDYYVTNVVDWGSQWIAEAKERRVTAFFGQIPNAPTLNANDLRVVQINTQINAALDTAEIKSTASEIEKTRSQINSLKSTIAAQKTTLQSISNKADYDSMQEQIATNTQDLQNLQASYTTLVNNFQIAVAENHAVVEDPKYHIRGFFPIPAYKYRNKNKTVKEEIIAFDIAYRYICENNTGTQLNTFNYTDTDGASTIQGTFTDWIIEQSAIKQRVFNNVTGMYDWKSENVADGSEININQIDIPITKGEKVEIKIRSISEAGYPDNPLKSEWSNTIIVSFPETLSTRNALADLIDEINDDALNIAITNNLDSIGVTTHLDDTIPNQESVNGIYFKHLSDNIAYEDIDGNTVSSISLQKKMEDIDARLSLLEDFINKCIAMIG